MLEALKTVDDNRARLVLSRASEELLESSWLQGVPVELSKEDYPIVAAVLDEVAKRIEATKPRDKEDQRQRMRETISKEMSEFVFSRSEPQVEIRRRLGIEGRLPTSLFELSFSPKFIQNEQSYGVSRAHAQNAVLHCDMFEHMMPVMQSNENNPLGSLFVQRSPAKGAANTILLKCDRVGDRLLIDDAYRIFDGELDILVARTPLDALIRFVERFGYDVEVQIHSPAGLVSRERKKIIIRQVYEIPEGGFLDLVFPDRSQRFLRSGNGLFEVNLFYCVNMGEYIAQLRRHGVKAEAGLSTMSGIVRTLPMANVVASQPR